MPRPPLTDLGALHPAVRGPWAGASRPLDPRNRASREPALPRRNLSPDTPRCRVVPTGPGPAARLGSARLRPPTSVPGAVCGGGGAQACCGRALGVPWQGTGSLHTCGSSRDRGLGPEASSATTVSCVTSTGSLFLPPPRGSQDPPQRKVRVPLIPGCGLESCCCGLSLVRGAGPSERVYVCAGHAHRNKCVVCYGAGGHVCICPNVSSNHRGGMCVHRFTPEQVCVMGEGVGFVKVPVSVCESLPPDRNGHRGNMLSRCGLSPSM